MTIKLEQKITGYEVVSKNEPVAVEEKEENNIIQMHEKVEIGRASCRERV